MISHKIKVVGKICYKKVGWGLPFDSACSFLNNGFIMRLPDMSPNGNPNHRILFGIKFNKRKGCFEQIGLNSGDNTAYACIITPTESRRTDWEIWVMKK